MPGNNAFVPVGVGFIVDVTIPDPGANTEFTYTFPDGYMYKVNLLYFLYTADANAGMRFASVELVDAGANQRALWGELGGMQANETPVFTYAKNFQCVASTGPHRMMAFPDIWIPGGWLLRSFTINMRVGDTYTNIRFTAARYREQS